MNSSYTLRGYNLETLNIIYDQVSYRRKSESTIITMDFYLQENDDISINYEK